MKLRATTAVVSNSRAMVLEPLRISTAMTSATAALNSITTSTAALSKANTAVLSRVSTATSHAMAALSTTKATDSKVATNPIIKTVTNPINKAMVSLSSH